MTIFSAMPHRRQTAWQCGTRNTSWYACIDAPIEDLEIIEDAKTIVDACRPQKYGPFGATFYSFLTREYLLNILLFHYADHGAFPKGSVCIVDEWVWKSCTRVGDSNWFNWKTKSNPRRFERPFWISIPSLEEAKLKIASKGGSQ
jgi:hypothetical protein